VISSFLRSLFGWIFSRALWVVVGVVALFLLIWYAGPLFAFGDWHPMASVEVRVWLIGLILAYFLLRFLLGRWRAGRMNERVAGMLKSSLASSAPVGDEGQVAVLRARFAESLEVLRKARFEKTNPSLWGRIVQHGRYVYELPWYVIIGAPGVGKTTALLNSGLSFPLAKKIGSAAIRGAGGTRNCDWWFSNEAVFLDTAGRYTTQETDAIADKGEWKGFLALLKKNRSRQPINGVLLMLSVADLLELNHEGLQNYAATMRRRLDELRNDLGVSFPVYLMINKCDLLLGFDEFFASLDRAGREQVWGYTLPLSPSGSYEFDKAQINTELKYLQARISAGLVDNLQGEHDLRRRELIYTFPQQFNVLAQVINDIAESLLAASRFSASPLLRGVYFTSATQEGNPFDRMVSSLGKGFPVQPRQKAPAVGEGKAFFLQELLSKVVFPEAHIAGADKRAERRMHAMHIGAYTLAVLTLCCSAIAWTGSYRNNLTYIAEVDQKVANFHDGLASLPRTNSISISGLLPILNMAETLPDSTFFRVDHPLLKWQFGLFQGGKLKAGAKPLYRQLLEKRFAPTLKANMESRLRSAEIDDLEFSYEVLKAYLMLHDPKHFSANEFVNYAKAAWGPDSDEVRHVQALISLGAAVPYTPMDAALVSATRSRLTQYTASQRAYHRIVKLLQKNNQLTGFSVTGEAGVQAQQVLAFRSGMPLTHSIPSLYTYRGYHELFKPQIENVLNVLAKDESWVLGTASGVGSALNDIASGKLTIDIKRHYVADYISRWERYLLDLTAPAPQSMQEAILMTETLSGVDSPLQRFMVGVARETTLYRDPSKKTQQSMLDKARQTTNAVVDDLRTLVPPDMIDQVAPRDIPEMAVNRRFATLQSYVGDGGPNSSMARSIDRIGDLHRLLVNAQYNKENKLPPPETSQVTAMKSSLGGVPEPVKDVLRTVAESSDKIIKEGGTVLLNDKLRELTEFCQKATAGRYPFSASGVGVTGNDFAELFGPGRRFDSFRQLVPPSVVLPPAFDQARVIQRVFFDSGSGPQITFSIKPVVMDPTITILTMSIGGQTVRYDHGPTVPVSIAWPGNGGDQVRVALSPPVDNGVNSLEVSGLWALHQLFGRYGRISPGANNDAFHVVLNVGERRATFEIRPTSIYNPFNLPEMRNFRCPTRVQ
jgi:type VI secretion system protein ImpL